MKRVAREEGLIYNALVLFDLLAAQPESDQPRSQKPDRCWLRHRVTPLGSIRHRQRVRRVVEIEREDASRKAWLAGIERVELSAGEVESVDREATTVAAGIERNRTVGWITRIGNACIVTVSARRGGIGSGCTQRPSGVSAESRQRIRERIGLRAGCRQNQSC